MQPPDSAGRLSSTGSADVVKKSTGVNGIASRTITQTAVARPKTGSAAALTFQSVSAGVNHVCAIASDNRAYCWGSNANGQLGNGTTTDSSTPVAVSQGAMPAGATISQISAGPLVTCAIASDGKPYCWGANYYLSGGNTSTPVLVYQGAIPTSATLSQISAGGYTECVIASDGNPYCWASGSTPNVAPSLPLPVLQPWLSY